MAKRGYLILENGNIFEGNSFGSEKEVKGEVVFNTGLVGYPESFTDASYYGQILTMTYPLIGNYGVPPLTKTDNFSDYLEAEKIHIRGLIVSTVIDDNSHWQSRYSLSQWLKKESVPALSGIDTRTLTKILREIGVMKGIITFQDPPHRRISFYDINKDNLIPSVSCKKIIRYGKGRIKVLLIDTGVKLNQIRILLKYDTMVIRVPWNYSPFLKESVSFDSIFLTNGPGDARMIKKTVQTVKEAINRKIPIFGICLGNQILTLAAGGDIQKMKYGHRSQNQPVKDITTGRCYISSQNHGYVAREETLPYGWLPWYKNLNDYTNEGIRHSKLPFFSVQFHPEASPGPTETAWLFEYFVDLTKRWLKKN